MDEPKIQYSLSHKGRGRAYQAVFSCLGEAAPFGTGECERSKAIEKCEAQKPRMLALLVAKAAAKGKPAAVSYQARAEAQPGQPAEAVQDSSGKPPEKKELPKLDLHTPPPKGSFRERIKTEVEFVENNKPGHHAKRDARDARNHIYKALGGYVDLSIRKMDGAMGDRLAAYFNDPGLFRLSGEKIASLVRRLLNPMVKDGLPREFIAALDKVVKQCHESDASDPYRANHFQGIERRLATGEEEDYLTGLHLMGCNSGPQLIDALLLLWEGVDFGTGWVKLYREKTKVIAEFKMTAPFRAWLWRRRQQALPDGRYVFAEVVCLDKDRGKPDYNQNLVSEKREGSISSEGAKLWRAFLHRAGVPVGLMTFVESDIVDLKGFIERLRMKTEYKYEWFFNRCKKNCRKALLNGATTAQEFKALEKMLRHNLNLFIEGDFGYDEKVVPNDKLRGQTRELLNPDYTGIRLYEFHRLFLEDAFPELRRIEPTNFSYSYSSYRKALVSFLRGLGFRDPVIAKIMGQEALNSQNIYDRVSEHELKRGCELTERHLEAMRKGESEFYPSIPFDFFEKMIEQFGVQQEARTQLATEFRRLLAEAEQRAQERQKEVLGALKEDGGQTRGMLCGKIDASEGRTMERLAAIEARLGALEEIGRRLIETIPPNMPAGARSHLITCIRLLVLLILWLASGNASPMGQIRLATRALELGPPANSEGMES